jgi:hypothetical protein
MTARCKAAEGRDVLVVEVQLQLKGRLLTLLELADVQSEVSQVHVEIGILKTPACVRGRTESPQRNRRRTFTVLPMSSPLGLNSYW